MRRLRAGAREAACCAVGAPGARDELTPASPPARSGRSVGRGARRAQPSPRSPAAPRARAARQQRRRRLRRAGGGPRAGGERAEPGGARGTKPAGHQRAELRPVGLRVSWMSFLLTEQEVKWTLTHRSHLSIRVFSNDSTRRMMWPKYWSFSFSISPSSEHPGLSYPSPRSGPAAERSNPTSKEWQLCGHRRAERSYSTFKVRRGDLLQVSGVCVFLGIYPFQVSYTIYQHIFFS
ncbi:uncharacterized protein LOC129552197 [Moschus berezovskii]|uniref:uncharacterized protein LOC129552197 n=1 Tax=Moschus berezovskii TaxID=68408 RepID=UPI002444824D|nr:uncharacterized protein LOC129552197 [Moschus berezovskii]